MSLDFSFPKTYSMEVKFLVSNTLDSFVEKKKKKIAMLETACKNLICKKEFHVVLLLLLSQLKKGIICNIA